MNVTLFYPIDRIIGKPLWLESLLRLRSFLRRLYPVDRHRIDEISKVFVLSTGRTGTKFLAHFFNTYATGTRGFHEPQPSCLRLGIESAYGRCALERSARILFLDRKFYLHCLDASTYVECNNRMFSLSNALQRAFPQCKIIHLVRDGREVVRSGMARCWYRDPWPRIKASQILNDPWSDEWPSFSAFEKACWLWQKKNAIIRRQTENYDNSALFQFEDLFKGDNDWSEMKRLIDFVDVEVNLEGMEWSEVMGRKINASRSESNWLDWSRENLEAFWRIAGNEMDVYGYC